MSLADVDNPRDPLKTLRIKRAAPPAPTRRPKRWVRRLAVLAVIAALGGVGIVMGPSLAERFKLMEAFQSPPEVRAGVVSVFTGRTADAVVVATGYLESRRQAKIGARAPGRIEILNVEEGSRVNKGQLLAALEHADLDASLAANKAELARSQAEVAEQEVEIARTKREYERMVKLQPTRAVSETDFDVAKFQYDGAVAKLASLKAAVDLAQARVSEAEQLKENMFVRAPFDGTVISKDAEVGESILPGGLGEGSGRGSVVTIADLASLEVDCDVKEDYISRVVVDRPAEIAVDAVPDRRYTGKVRKVIPMGDRARATIKVKVAVVDADDRLFPEMSATVYFLPEENEKPVETAQRKILCPRDAIVEADNQSFVWRIAEERIERVEVQTGAVNDKRTEILSGLAGGEQVVLEPSEKLHAGQRVKVAE